MHDAGQLKVTLPFPVSARGSRPSLDISKTGRGPRACSASALDDDALEGDNMPVDLTDAPVDQACLSSSRAFSTDEASVLLTPFAAIMSPEQWSATCRAIQWPCWSGHSLKLFF